MADLKAYRAKRDFSRTAEPSGEAAPKAGEEPGGIFVVHKHDASRLHYDFRIEHGGVLWSWAVTRGPSLDPAEKRLAVQVEDHPLDYASFEGTIPEGEYGGGAVIIWDEGRWRPEGDPAAGLEKGRLSFSLDGSKLRGGWHLVRMKPRQGEKRPNWLLVKADDAAASPDGDILEEQPASVRSGRTVEEMGGKPSPAARPSGAKAEARKTSPRKKTSDLGKPVKAGAMTLTSPEKLLWPDVGISKKVLLDHYRKVWKRMAPFLLDRPLTLVRAPDGVGGKHRFFQQHSWSGMPAAVRTMRDPADGAELLFVDGFDGLAALVQFGTVEIHGWGAKASSLTQPDQITFDLDPDEGIGAAELHHAVLEIKAGLDRLGLVPFVKTSGGKGFHITAPIAVGTGWRAVEAFASGFAHNLTETHPTRFTAASAKAERAGRIFIDYLRNNPNATTVLPWSSRARQGATVSVPLSWRKFAQGVGPADYVLGGDKLARALRAKDPWANFFASARPLPSFASETKRPRRSGALKEADRSQKR